jgi:hypothetical protein
MIINWFEGGRRIFSALCGLIFLGGAIYLLVGGGKNQIILESKSPRDNLHWTLKACEYPDFEKAWSKEAEFSPGHPRTIVACFRANVSGKIDYTSNSSATNGLGSPEAPAKILEAYPYSGDLDEYARSRMDALRLNPQEVGEIRKGLWKIAVANFCERALEAFPWVAGLIIGLWCFSVGVGWLMRGFAGIPKGRDFKADDLNTAARSNRVSLDWLVMTGVAYWFFTIAAWVILEVISPPASPVGWFVGKIFYFAGGLIAIFICFSAFFAGAQGLRTLTFRFAGRKPPELDNDDYLVTFGFSNLLLAGSVYWLLNNYTIAGYWFSSLDHWTRGNGFADGGVMALFMVCLLWPWVLLSAFSRVFAQKDDE